MRASTRTVLFTLLAASYATQASALTAASADDICPPAQNPCVISATYDVTGPLDFGLRSVSITKNGRLRGTPHVDLKCGSLMTDSDELITPSIEADGGSHGDVSITAFRACSGDTATRCLTDTVCAALGQGTCSAGSGTVVINRRVTGTGSSPGTATIQAAGDITIARRVNFNASGVAKDGGSIAIESFQGSVVSSADITARSSESGAYGYYGGDGGAIRVRAAVDVTLGAQLNVWGRLGGGNVTVEGGRDVSINSDIMSNGGGGGNAQGGRVYITADRDIIVAAVPNGDSVQVVNTDGGTSFYFYGYGSSGSWYSGYGGYQYWTAGKDIALASSSRVRSVGGRAAGGGSIYFDALGSIDVGGEIRAQGTPPLQGVDSGAGGGFIQLVAGHGIRLGAKGIITTASPLHGGQMRLNTDGPVELFGTIDVRGVAPSGDYKYSTGGYFDLAGNIDASISGKILGGGNSGGEDMTIDVCRLDLQGTSIIKNVHNPPGQRPGDVRLIVHESMQAGPKTKILNDTVGGGRTMITYRDPRKPPVLAGTVSPAPILAANPSLAGCPVCGNSEIDAGESCDDGNAVSGDGCRSDCQDEGCLAQSPGFPETPLCDDGNGCTVDWCDPVAHQCTNVFSCEEGIACTIDTCVSNQCVHTPSDALCDDRNDCTEDLCNVATDCVHAKLTGGPCHDGDFCTVSGECDRGDCVVTNASYSSANHIRVKLVPGPANDTLRARARLPLGSLATAPTISGMRVVMVDAVDDVVYEAHLPASDWNDRTGLGSDFRFQNTQGLVPSANGVRSVSLKHYPTKGHALLKLAMYGTELPRAADQGMLSASFLFGSDPAADDCVTARRVACRTKGTTITCKG